MANDIVAQIKDAFPNVDDYHMEFITGEVVGYLERVNNHEDPIWVLPLDQLLRVRYLNNIRDQIRYDILEQGNGPAYDYKEDANKPDYERGVLAAIHMIEHQVHCICDD